MSRTLNRMTCNNCNLLPSRRSDSAFTLVELLVVIVILALLLGLGIPALSTSISASKQARCASNLRQIFQIAETYSSENNLHVVPLGFFEILDQEGYLSMESDVWVCPEDDRPDKTSGLPHDISYACNANLTGWNANWYQGKENTLRLENLSSIVYFADADAYWMNDHPANQNVSFRHNQKANVLFLDGHVESVKADASDLYDKF